MSNLLGLLANIAAGPRREELPENSPKLRLRLFVSCFQACALVGVLSLAANPSVFCPSLSRWTSLPLFAGAVLIGSMTTLAMGPRLLGRFAHLRVGVIGLSYVVAAGAMAVALFAPPLREIALCLVFPASGIFLPWVLLSWGIAFASFSREEVLASSVAGFAVLDAFLILQDLLPSAFPFALLASLVLGLMGHLTIQPLLASGRPSPYEDDGCQEHDAHEEPSAPAGRAERSHVKETMKLRSLLCTVPFLGVALYLFTQGLVDQKEEYAPFIVFFTVAALAAVILGCVTSSRATRGASPSNKLFVIFDIGVPGAAVVGFAIKMVPLGFVSQTLFPCFMEAYFGVLALAFWMNLAFFGMSNKTLLPRACGFASGCGALALVVGAVAKLSLPPVTSVVLGLVTAAFLILAIVSVGYNLILFSKGTESDAELSPNPLSLSDVCRAISEDHHLTPRESEVLEELAVGHSSGYIAKVLYISNNTARSHMKNIYRKLDIRSREELIELLRRRQNG
mgnify:FL=1